MTGATGPLETSCTGGAGGAEVGTPSSGLGPLEPFDRGAAGFFRSFFSFGAPSAGLLGALRFLPAEVGA